MNIALFVDTFDLYRHVRHIFNNKIDYESYFEKVKDLGKVVKYSAYGMQAEGGFISCLKNIGFETRFKNPRIIREIKFCDWNVQIAMDAVRSVNDFDTVVFGSCSLGLIPLIKWLKEKDIKVIIFATDIPKSLRNLVDEVIEIDENMLEEIND